MATTADPAPARTPRGHLVAPPRPPGALRGVRAHHPQGRAAGADPTAPMMPRNLVLNVVALFSGGYRSLVLAGA